MKHFFSYFRKKKPDKPEKRQWKLNEAITVLANANLSNLSSSGVSVNESTALAVSAVYACVRVLAEGVAMLPFILYQRSEQGKKRAVDHSLYNLLHDSPNSLMTAFEFRETMMGHLALRGNAYALKDINSRGEVEALWPLNPTKMTPYIGRKGDLKYQYSSERLSGDYPEYMILHIKGLSPNGVIGYSPLKLSKEVIGTSKAAEEYSGSFFSNDASPGGVLTHPHTLTDKARDNLEKSWNKKHGSAARSHKMSILEEGLQWQQVGIAPDDAQLIQSRKFQVNEICRIFRVPPHLIADLERSTFSNIEQQSLEFVIHTLGPWLVRWEQSVLRSLLTSEERKRYFAEHLVDGLLRGDVKTRYEAYAVAKNNGWMNGDEIRAKENLNPMPEGLGKVYTIPLNMMLLGEKYEGANNPDDSQSDKKDDRGIDPNDHNRIQVDHRSHLKTQEERSVVARDRITSRYYPLFKQAAQEIVNREGIAIKKEIKKQLGNRSKASSMEEWLNEFYRDLPDYIRLKIGPVFRSFAESIKDEALDELGKSSDEISIENFISDYVDRYAERHINSSQRQLVELLTDELDKVSQRVDEWSETRPEKIAANETVRAGNGAFQFVVFAFGLRTIWRIRGSKTCPYCRSLDGRVISSGQSYLNDGDLLDPEGGKGPMKIRGLKKHPPLHSKCDCFLGIG